MRSWRAHCPKRPIEPGEKDIGLDPKRGQVANAVLGRLGLSSPAAGDVGDERGVDRNGAWFGNLVLPRSLRICRIASMNGRLSMSPTVPPISQMMKSCPSVASRRTP